MKPQNTKILAYIPARSGSKRIPNKNIKKFLGRPLISYTIKQALSCRFIDRVIVDTDSEKIAKVARDYGAEVPFIRPPKLAGDKSMIIDSILYLLDRLEDEQNYKPDYLLILQTTSPLRELEDIQKCWKLIQSTEATTVLTVCPTHPRLYYMNKTNDISLVNGSEKMSTNMQAWPNGYILNGCFVYIVDIKTLKKEKRVVTSKTKAIVCPKWRSVDLDTPEEWVLAELLYKNKKRIYEKIKRF